MKKLVQFFIDQAKVVNMIVIIITLAGGWIFYAGQKEGFPNVKMDMVWVMTTYFGASPKEVETLLTDKIEDAIEDVDGAKKVTSRSIEGMSTVIFEIDSDYSEDTETVVNDIRAAVDNIDDLPEDAVNPMVFEIKMDMIPVISVIVAGEASEAVLRKAAKLVEKDLKKLKGVGKLETDGYRAQEIWVEVDPKRLKQLDIDVSDIILAIKLRSINLPGGKIILSDKEYLIRTIGQYKTLDDVKNTVVRGNDAGKIITVADVGKVRWAYEKMEFMNRINGRTVINHRVLKKSSADIIKTCDRVKDLLKKYEEQNLLPPGVRVFESDDFSFFVKRRLNVLSYNLLIGLVMIFLCLILFLDLKTTIWTTLGIPIAFCTAMLLANYMGITLNLMSMFGFIIVVGMIVDDAIIVAENIFRHREMGKDGLTAAIEGTVEVFRPVTATVLTTVVCFMPLILIGGMMGKFMGIIPKIVAITMLSSLVECLFVLPGHIIYTKKQKNSNGNNNLPAADQKEEQELDLQRHRTWYKVLQKWYGKLLSLILRNSKKSFAIIVAVSIFLAAFSFNIVPKVFFPTTIDEFQVILEAPVSNSLEKTQKTIDHIEKQIQELLGNDVRETICNVGWYDTHNSGPKFRSYIGAIRVILELDRERKVDEMLKITEGVVAKLQKQKEIVDFKVRQMRGGPPQEKPISLKIYGNDLNKMKSVLDEIYEIAQSISNVDALETSYEVGKDEIVLEIDEAKAALVKVNVNSTALAVRNAFEGGVATTANSLKGMDEDVEIIVKYNERAARSMKDLTNVKIKNTFGKLIPLNKFADISFDQSLAIINHEDNERVMYITGELKNPRDRIYTSQKIAELLADRTKEIRTANPDLYIDVNAASGEQMDLIMDGVFAGIIAIFLVLVILVALFKSFLQPFMVISVIPFGFVGVSMGVLVHYIASFVFDMTLAQYSFSFMTVLGLVALMGVVVNDSLVLVSFVNHNRQRGMDKVSALLEGGKARLRPIILTTVTTLVGLIPLAYGIMGKEPFIQPMGIALIWGLMFATMITLLILPCIYYLVDGLAERVYRLMGKEYKLPTTLEE